jgi:hypothetical protein
MAGVALLLLLPACSGPQDTAEPSKTRAAVSASVEKQPSSPVTSATPTPSAEGSVIAGTGPSHFHVRTVTTGSFGKSGLTTELKTQPITFPAHTLTFLHLMSCCDHAAVPTVTAGSVHFDLVVTHPTGEKRHWVYRASTERQVGPIAITFAFEQPQSVILWIVDSVEGAALGRNGADAIVQTAEQDSQANADRGAIELPVPAAQNDAVFLFGLAGSGAADDIVPARGMTETGQAESAGANLIIENSWGVGPHDPLRATFVNDTSGKSEIQSWLFLAVEVRGR